nr:sugar transferase [Planosporangium flavigriseum]
MDAPAGRHDPWRKRLTALCVAVVAFAAVVTTLPLWIVIVGLIWIEEPGPIFVSRRSLRADGTASRLLRFRCVRSDGRTLVVGLLLRRLRLVRLPQMAAVLVRAVNALRPRLRPRPRTAARSLARRPIAAPVAAVATVLLVGAVAVAALDVQTPRQQPVLKGPVRGLAVPQAFDPAEGAVLPNRRVVAFYGVPGAAQTGPAATLDAGVLDRLRAQGAEYEKLDPAHPVALGIDLVASVPDSDPGPAGTYSHRLDGATMDRYVDFCRTNGLLLFLDLSFGWSDPRQELEHFMSYLALPFVHLAIDPEWMFPRHNGVPGINLSNVRADDLNPLITAMAELPVKYRIPRKIVIIHQFRPTGDGMSDPYDPGNAEIADKRNLVDDPRVDLVVHVDSVGGWVGDIPTKVEQYDEWIRRDMKRFRNFQYGGFKIFYQIESKNRLMTPAEVMKLKPPPMVVTYGN